MVSAGGRLLSWFPISAFLILATVVIIRIEAANTTITEERLRIESDDSVITWLKRKTEIFFTPEELAKISPDQLPSEYYVITKKKLRYWTSNRIPYVIDWSLRNATEVIKLALMNLTQTLGNCIEFPTRLPSDRDFIRFVRRPRCGAPIGFRGGRHDVKLNDGCIGVEQLGAIQHEVLHVLGFYHEHSRHDRDEYIKIDLSNVSQNGTKDLRILNFSTFGLPYDYGSVMHYGPEAYAINETKETIIRISPVGVGRKSVGFYNMGQRAGLSDLDILRVSIAYNCEVFLNSPKYKEYESAIAMYRRNDSYEDDDR